MPRQSPSCCSTCKRRVERGHVTAGDDRGALVVDADLETSWAPIDKLDGSLGFDVCNGGIDVLGDNITTVEQTTRHVLAVTRVALYHLVAWLKAGRGDLHNRVLLVQIALGADDWRVSGEGKVNSWIGHEIGLELVQVNV